MKTHSPTIFLAHMIYNIFLIFTDFFFLLNYCFSGTTAIYLLEFSNINTRIQCKICSKLTTEAPDVILMSLLLNLNKFEMLLL